MSRVRFAPRARDRALEARAQARRPLRAEGDNDELDVDEISARWLELAAIDDWSQLIMKTSDPQIRFITAAPSTGVYAVDRMGRCNCVGPDSTGTASPTAPTCSRI